MNKDWRFYKQIGFFTATILAGAILLNTSNYQAIMINTVEMYGRTKSVDQHRGSFEKLKRGARPNSLPPPIKTLHPDVWPVSLEQHGMEASNALVASSARLDEKLPVSIGGMTTHFRLNNIKDSFWILPKHYNSDQEFVITIIRYNDALLVSREDDTELDNDEEFKPDECISQAQGSELFIKKRRTYNEAAISACHKEGSTQYDKNNTSYILQNLSLHPFSVVDNEGNEENALAHSTVINKLVSKHNAIRAITPLKRLCEDSLMCISCSPSINTDLKNLFAASPYSTLLKQREYVLLTVDICTEMNKDWRFYKQIGFFTATILAGAILLNTNNNQTIIINTSFEKLKRGARPNSLPPPIKTLHPDVWPVSLEQHGGLHMEASNALVASSARLDEKLPVFIGGMTTHFRLDNIKDSLAFKVFLTWTL
ncbi:hypothetical protein INT45_006383 [Circinella minor]|uniref:Uncharacterized protein n=1 Tax=Circinella minor TaxID=1195481 RepID=A0A8H7SD65_9FUNG|nr:hypothetical protein INT45_006383 [Circinella minor]